MLTETSFDGCTPHFQFAFDVDNSYVHNSILILVQFQKHYTDYRSDAG